MCVYEASVPDRKRVSDRKPALPEPQPSGNCKSKNGIWREHIRWRAIKPQPEQSLRHKREQMKGCSTP
ncbi:unnamed protein product [Penicillium salamii]|nr:unnamed protein product [Penicillium salamii]